MMEEGGGQKKEQRQRGARVCLGKKKGGGTRLFPVIIVNEVAERILSASVTANLIIYLTTKYHLGAANSAIIIFVYQAAANFFPFCGAIVSDALVGRYLMVTITLFFCSIGATLLWVSSVVPSMTPPECSGSAAPPNNKNQVMICSSPTALQLLALCASLGLMSLGASGVRPCTLAFAEEQIAHWEDTARKDRALRTLFSWYYVSVGFAQMMAVTVLVFIQDSMGWHVGFAVSAAAVTLVTLVNLAVSPLYVKVKPEKSMWASLLQVAVAAVKNRHLTVPPAAGNQHGGVQYFHSSFAAAAAGSSSSQQVVADVVPSEKMRFLNKACILRTTTQQQQADPSSSTTATGGGNTTSSSSSSTTCCCTVEQVENLKSALSVMPMWSAMVMSFLVQSSSFGVLQAAAMDRRIFGATTTRFQIPAGSISIFDVITFTLWSGCYDSYIVPFLRTITRCRRRQVLTLKQRMGLGLFFCVASTAVAAAVEARRREAATTRHVRISALWLVPQYVLSGLSGAFSTIGQIEFYYAVLPKSMGSLVLALLFLGSGVACVLSTVIVKLVNVITGKGGRATPWISNDLNQGRYDYYYLLLAVLAAVDLVYLLVCAYVFDETTQGTTLETTRGDDDVKAAEMVEFRQG